MCTSRTGRPDWERFRYFWPGAKASVYVQDTTELMAEVMDAIPPPLAWEGGREGAGMLRRLAWIPRRLPWSRCRLPSAAARTAEKAGPSPSSGVAAANARAAGPLPSSAETTCCTSGSASWLASSQAATMPEAEHSTTVRAPRTLKTDTLTIELLATEDGRRKLRRRASRPSCGCHKWSRPPLVTQQKVEPDSAIPPPVPRGKDRGRRCVASTSLAMQVIQITDQI